MTTEPIFTDAGRPRVRVERRYPHPIATVWRAVTSPEHLGAWFPSPVEIDLSVGGAMRFSAFAGDAAATGTVETLDPPRLLAFRWGSDRLTFELTPDGDGTVFALTHAFDDRAGAPSFATGWETCLAGLRQVLAAEPVPPPDRGVARHEELVAAFGLDRPEITGDAGGWTVRFERQLTCPAQVAWDLWFGPPGAPAVGEPLMPYAAPDRVVGTMTEVDEPHVLAFDVAPSGGPGDHVRVALTPGTGHGARLVLTVRGADPHERDLAVAQWGGAAAHLAGEAARRALAAASG